MHILAASLFMLLSQSAVQPETTTKPNALAARQETANVSQCILELSSQARGYGYDPQDKAHQDLRRALVAECNCRIENEQRGQTVNQAVATCQAFTERKGGDAFLTTYAPNRP